jgi:hypothetical protein
LVLGKEAIPALAEGFRVGLGGESLRGFEGLIIEEQVEADAIEAMADVDDGFQMGLGAVFAPVQVEGSEEGMVVTERGAALNDGVAKVRVAFLG